MQYYYDLGDAAKFATYDESTNTLKVQNVTLEDAGDYRLVFKARKSRNDKTLLKKYVHIFVIDQINDYDRTDPSF